MNTNEAEDFLKRELKTDKPVADDKALKDIKFNKVTVNHVGMCNSLAKIACVVPMPQRSREVIIYKLANPGISNFQMAIMSGCRVMDILAWEEEGKNRIKRYMERYSEQEMIDKANCNETILNEVRNLKAKDAPLGGDKLN